MFNSNTKRASVAKSTQYAQTSDRGPSLISICNDISLKFLLRLSNPHNSFEYLIPIYQSHTTVFLYGRIKLCMGIGKVSKKKGKKRMDLSNAHLTPANQA